MKRHRLAVAFFAALLTFAGASPSAAGKFGPTVSDMVPFPCADNVAIRAPERIAQNPSPDRASPRIPPEPTSPQEKDWSSRWENRRRLRQQYPGIQTIVETIQTIDEFALEKPDWRSLLSRTFDRIEDRIAPCTKSAAPDNGFSVQCGDGFVRVDSKALEGDGKFDVANRLSDLVSECAFRESPDPKRNFRELFLAGIARSLEARSAYLTTSDIKRFEARSRTGYAADTGIQLGDLGERLDVIVVDQGSPADKAGIRPGCFMTRIDNTSTAGMTSSDAYRLMEGEAGTEVVVWLLKKGESEPRAFTIRREKFEAEAVRYRGLGAGIGYIKLRNFPKDAARDVERALVALERAEEGIEGLVLDLRNNTGGLLDQVIKVTDLFVDSGLIVWTDGRVESQRYKYFARTEGSHTGFPVVVLVNRISAVGAEIVAGSLQDHGRAIVVGTRTAGAGGIRTVLPLQDGSALLLTTGRAVLPKGRSFLGVGIEPDVRVEENDGDQRSGPGQNNADSVLEAGLNKLREMARH